MTGINQALKVVIIVFLSVLLIPLNSHADRMRGGGGYHMMGSGMMSQLTNDEQKIVNDLVQKYHGPMMELKKQLFAKRAELNAVMAQEKFDAKKARSLSKEISALQSKFMEQHAEMFIEMREKGVSYYGTCMSGSRMGHGIMMNDGMMGRGMMMDDRMMGSGMMNQNQNMMQPEQE